LQHALRRQRGGSGSGGGERIGHAALDEVMQLRLHPRGRATVRRQRDGFRADIVAKPCFDGVSRERMSLCPDRFSLILCDTLCWLSLPAHRVDR
jgi:hypothetical protein